MPTQRRAATTHDRLGRRKLLRCTVVTLQIVGKVEAKNIHYFKGGLDRRYIYVDCAFYSLSSPASATRNEYVRGLHHADESTLIQWDDDRPTALPISSPAMRM
jgi:hypothetical protein